MQASTSLTGEESARFLNVIHGGLAVSTHAGLLRWLQGDVQQFLPHDILIAGWGDFEEGALQHDVVSDLPGVRSYAAGSEALPFLLAQFHRAWTVHGHKPCMRDFRESAHLLGSTSLPDSFSSGLRSMRSVLVHGIRDERSRLECVYVFLGAAPRMPGAACDALTLLLPSIDSNLRRIAHLPQQYRQPAAPPPPKAAHDDCGLSERETQIMAWVAMGKTNSEIGSILNISGYTVKNHMQRIFQKLNVYNRAQAVSKVTRVGLDG